MVWQKKGKDKVGLQLQPLTNCAVLMHSGGLTLSGVAM